MDTALALFAGVHVGDVLVVYVLVDKHLVLGMDGQVDMHLVVALVDLVDMHLVVALVVLVDKLLESDMAVLVDTLPVETVPVGSSLLSF